MRSGSRIHYVHARVGWCVVRLHHIQNQVLTLWLEVSECQFEACHNASIPTCVLTVFRIWSLLPICSKCNFSLILRGGEWGTRLSCWETYMEVMGFWLRSWMCLADVTFWRETCSVDWIYGWITSYFMLFDDIHGHFCPAHQVAVAVPGVRVEKKKRMEH